MSQLALNGINTAVDPRFITWQDLLQDLESKQLSREQVIASVRFDGDEVSQFRGDDVLGRPLRAIQQIRVEAVAMKEMLANAVEEAGGYLFNLETSMVDVAETFRTGSSGQANVKLQQVFNGVKILVTLLRGVELALSTTPQNGASKVEQQMEQMGTTLKDLISAQTAQDWMLVADMLEYELVGHLSTFENVIGEFKQQLNLA
jgi:hypothetical protein